MIDKRNFNKKNRFPKLPLTYHTIDLLAVLKTTKFERHLFLRFIEISNVHNKDKSSNATRSNLVYENV